MPEGEPGAHFVRVVGAGHEGEEPGEGVAGGQGDLPHFAAGRAQVPECQVDTEVAQLAQREAQQTHVHLNTHTPPSHSLNLRVHAMNALDSI